MPWCAVDFLNATDVFGCIDLCMLLLLIIITFIVIMACQINIIIVIMDHDYKLHSLSVPALDLIAVSPHHHSMESVCVLHFLLEE